MKQSVALYDKSNKLVGGNPNNVQNVTEYVVMERWLGKEDAEEEWKIAGKITPNF